MKTKKETYPLFKIFSQSIFDIMRVIPLEFAFNIFFNITQALSSVLVVICTQHFFDSASKLNQNSNLCSAIIPLVLFSCSYIVMEICNGLANFQFEFLSPKYLEHMYQKLHKKCAQINAISYENVDFLNQINKAKEGIECGFMASLLVISIFSLYIPYYIFMTLYVRNLSPILTIAILLVFIPVILGKAIRFRIFSQIENKIAPMRRKMDYYEQVICDKEYFKETRMLCAFPYFINLFKEMRNNVNHEITISEKQHARIEFFLRLITITGYLFILALLIRELLSNHISIGAFAAIFESISMMYHLADEVFGGVLQYITRNAASIQNFQKFMAILDEYDIRNKEITCDKNPLNPNKIYFFNNVHFKYPGATTEAIKGITLTICKNQTIAIVGENGSGKSTFVKLLLGLYPPTKGTIYTDNTINTLNYSAIFQDFQKYPFSLKDNIIISDYKHNNEKDFKNACKQAELYINPTIYPNREQTILSREFGGKDLSGGQWQRVAIARALYKTHNVIILDEPTSAIDPIEESRLYQNFSKLSHNKTSIIVTHRVGAAQIADLIIVMADGKIAETGTHQSLIQKNGIYAKLFHEQAKWYVHKY